jgi:hypothetical protein
MLKKRPDTYKIRKDIPEQEIPEITRGCFNLLKRKFGYSARISEFIPLLETTLGEKLDSFSPYSWNFDPFLSYLIDLQIAFMKGQEIDMAELHTKMLEAYPWSGRDKRTFIEKDLEQRLWAMFLVITDPSHDYYNIYTIDI